MLAALLLGLMLLCCGCLNPPWKRFSDSRQYPHADGPFHISYRDDDLERDLLPIYGVDLPCGAANLRYGNLQEPINQLYLRFTAPAACLERFRTTYRLAPGSTRYGMPDVPAEYGWRISSSARLYRGDFDDNEITLLVEDTAEPQTAYLLLERWGAPRSPADR
ncbi:hypothetical protein [Catellatospora sp. TT07R-123]|uniref:hypothetical protein n=1 Tax=Catellatospora sp. TT07R-123 TaxID=2733863 RepID=UPI001BB3E12F|nr:hypothetical protein [Catellatospora sp. TT07R-123]